MDPKKKETMFERVAYRFTLYSAQDQEIIEFLDSIPKPLRGKVILQALKLLKEKYSLIGEIEKGNQEKYTIKFDKSFNL